MPAWLEILVAVVAIVGPALAGYVGVQAGLAAMKAQLDDAREEIRKLREAKHEHAQFLTQHEMRLEMLERQSGAGR